MGAAGMADQIKAAAEHFRAERVALIDVGGDALTDGHDPGPRSPIADQLAIAACLRAGLPAHLIAAPGVDGELDLATLRRRLEDLHGQQLPPLTAADLDPVRRVFQWHPSEASELLLAAADGHREATSKSETPATKSPAPTTPPACTVSS